MLGRRGADVLPLLARPGAAVIFCLGAVVFAAGTVLDYVAISERRSLTLILRSLVMSGLRLPLLFVPVRVDPPASAARPSSSCSPGSSPDCSRCWSAVLGFGRKSTAAGRCAGVRPDAVHLREMASSFLGQHLITVAAMLAGYLLPVLVVARLSAADNGYFYITWMLGSVFSIISPAVSTALFAEGAATPAALPALVRRCALLIGVLLGVPIVVYLVAGGWLLDLFGPGYAEHGRLLLIVLTVAAVPDAITNIAVAVLRATGRLRRGDRAERLDAGDLPGRLLAAAARSRDRRRRLLLARQPVARRGLRAGRRRIFSAPPARPRRAVSPLASGSRGRRPVRVLQVSDGYPPATGGLERTVQALARELARRGHASEVATLSHPGAPTSRSKEPTTAARSPSVG